MKPLPASPAWEQAVVEGLRAGDEGAFLTLFQRYHAGMVRLARMFVGSDTAEDVAQEAWLSVLRGIATFEGRGSLRAWIMSIVANRARSRIGRDARSVPFSALGEAAAGDGPAVPAERFRPPGDREWPGHWATLPAAWPEERLVRRETLDRVRRAIDGLPPARKAVITLRDVEGWGADETCTVLGITEENQRVLLHRARSAVRRALEEYMTSGEGAS